MTFPFVERFPICDRFELLICYPREAVDPGGDDRGGSGLFTRRRDLAARRSHVQLGSI